MEPWKWQSYIFEENIIETVNESRKDLKNLSDEYDKEFQKFEFKVI